MVKKSRKKKIFTGLGVREFFVDRHADHALVAFVVPLSVGVVTVIIFRSAPKLARASVLDKSERQVFVVVEVIQNLVVRVVERVVSRSLEGNHEDGLQNVFNG